MKTLKDIEAEAKPLRDIIGNKKSLLKDVKKARKRLTFLRHLARYLETKPTEDCVRRQFEDVKHKIITYNERFPSWRVGRTGSMKEHQQQYNKETGMSQLKAQLRTTKYLLE